MSTRQSRVRAPRFESAEKTKILSLVGKYAHILENKRTDAVTSNEKAKAWLEITAEVNKSCPSSYYRSSESISKFWKNSKKMVRHQAAQERQERIKTGGGIPDIQTKDENYETVLSIINETTVFGHGNPFDSDKVPLQPQNQPDKDDQFDIELYNDENIEILFDNRKNSDVPREGSLMDVGISEYETYQVSQPGCSQTKEASTENLPRNTWKKYKPAHLQAPVNPDLENAIHVKSKNNVNNTRRRPTVQVKALTSSLVAEKYEILLDKRINIAAYNLQLLQQQLRQQAEEHKLKLESLKLDIELKKRKLDH